MVAVVDRAFSVDAVEASSVPAIDCSPVDAGLPDSVDVCMLESFSVAIKAGVLVNIESILSGRAVVDMLDA